jgi:hypothetical protein
MNRVVKRNQIKLLRFGVRNAVARQRYKKKPIARKRGVDCKDNC